MNPAQGRLLGIVANTAMLWLAMGIAALTWWPIYEDARFVILIAVVMIVGSAIAIAGAVFRWPSIVVVLATLGAFLTLGVPLAVPDSATLGIFPSFDGLRQLLTGAALSWKQLLTITLPVASYQALLVPPFVLCLLAIVVGLTIALRSRRGDLAVLAPALFFVAGIAFGPKVARLPVELSLSLLATLLLWLLWRRWHRRRAAVRLVTGSARSPGLLGFRTVLSAILVIVLAGATAVVASAAIPPAGSREVLRTVVEQPFDPRDYVSPLVGFRRYLKSDDARAVMFTVSGLPEGALLRIATLDSYDGVVYALGSSTVHSLECRIGLTSRASQGLRFHSPSRSGSTPGCGFQLSAN
jgi:TgpA N-terminal domain